MSPPTNRRMPLSCEPCRARKIRCAPNRSPPGPCGSCVRRGILPSKCIYLRQTYQASHPTQEQSSTTSNEELLARIRNLEDILNGHMRAFSSPNQHPTTFVTEASHVRPESSELFLQQPTPSSLSLDPLLSVGSLHVSGTGHLRYEARASQWTHDSPTATVVRNFDTIYGNSPSCVPFELNPVASMDDLLMLLPPTRQCDKLKAVFFEVFSPVRRITVGSEQSLNRIRSCSTFYTTQPSRPTTFDSKGIQNRYRYHG